MIVAIFALVILLLVLGRLLLVLLRAHPLLVASSFLRLPSSFAAAEGKKVFFARILSRLAAPHGPFLQMCVRQFVAAPSCGSAPFRESGRLCVFFLHGIFDNSSIWESFFEPLGLLGLDSVAMDLPGHGLSDGLGAHDDGYQRLALAAVQVLDTLGYERVIVVGHSMGGGVAQIVASLRPQRVVRLVLLAPVVALPREVPSLPALAKVFGRLPHPLVLFAALHFVSVPLLACLRLPFWGVQGMRSKGNEAHSARAVALNFATQAGVRNAYACAQSVAQPQALEALAAALPFIHCPVNIVAGTWDRVVEVEHSRRLARWWTENKVTAVTLSILHRVGHIIPDERPIFVLDLLRDLGAKLKQHSQG